MPFDAKAALQCVTYARDVTGLNLKGDAWKWWEAADGLYDRGKAPREGAVLVFKRQGSMSHGHVAVVRKTTSARIMLVDHANWAPHRSAGRGQVAEGVPVMDVSPNNDWSEVRVWYRPSAEYGSRVYKTQGFVYRPGKSSPVVPASLRSEAAVAPAEQLATPTVKIEIPAPMAASPVAVPVAATPEKAAEPGKFDARAWAEQA
ncbi:MAG: CHAP domain-containing protein [Magnetospirillum sp.]|nr:MAG: CHAP domain-containing protein [Magnetospirillum sp.]